MSVLTTTNISKSFGAVDIFSNISIAIPPGARIALVGPNGIGKTTLLRVLVGLEEPSDGEINRSKGLKIGYLPQEAGLTGENTLWEACLGVMEDLRVMEKELAHLEKLLGNSQQTEEILEQYGRLQDEFEHRGGYVYEARIQSTLGGLGFSKKDFQRPITQLSGGQRTRAYLARLLLSDPDLLILDEPTNHLDISTVEWLEGYLTQWRGSVVVVSHDRYFLDKVVDYVWEMVNEGLEVYRGNYSGYLQQRQERWELSAKIYSSEMERLEKELDYIKRNIAGQGTLQAKGKLRRLSREVEAIEKLGFQAVKQKNWAEVSDLVHISDHMMGIEEIETRIRALRGPRARPPQLHLKLKSDLRSGDLVLRTRSLEIGYKDEGRPLFHSPDLLLKRGECASIIGPNGAGKTTFLKTLLQINPPYSGEVVMGASLQIGYFAQAHEDLNPEFTLVEEIEMISSRMLLADIRSYLAQYGFRGDDVFRYVSTLSGGERGRLALAKLSLSKANLLLLDEPTNHLDIPSQEILQHVLSQFDGTIILVSHDRYLIDALGTQIWEINSDESSLQVFKGSYSEMRAEAEADKVLNIDSAREKYKNNKRRTSHSKNIERQKSKRLREIEEKITDLEDRLQIIAKRLEDPPQDPQEVHELGSDYIEIQSSIDALMVEWEKIQN